MPKKYNDDIFILTKGKLQTKQDLCDYIEQRTLDLRVPLLEGICETCKEFGIDESGVAKYLQPKFVEKLEREVRAMNLLKPKTRKKSKPNKVKQARPKR